ncbi:serine/threonine-protein kinase [Actinomadura nitritigenes]|uniref:serine/threonine-protein kinase n=1 Tax=Actinomadura nitritigenes TaxID=134602 RepID=UPI003D91FAD6
MGDWQVSGFRECRELGRGGQGRVVLATHEESGTPVAIKYVSAGQEESVQRLYRREAQMLGKVDDPHVARLYQLVENGQGAAIIMEAVDGVSLKELLARHGALGPRESLVVLKGSLLGLAAAHAAGVVHRDYKPANVVVRGDGQSKLIDFGIAVLSGEGSKSGTPPYMAPEQWRGDPVTAATDVYAATCVFFECVTGDRPYAGRLPDLMDQHLSAHVPADRVPEPLRDLVERGMAKEAPHRPASAAAFVEELEAVAVQAYGEDWEHQGIRALAVAAAALSALFPVTAAGLRTGPSTSPAAHPENPPNPPNPGSAAQGKTGAVTSAKVAIATAAAAATVAAAAVAGYLYVHHGSDSQRQSSPPAANASKARPTTTTPIALTLAGTFTLTRAHVTPAQPSGNQLAPLLDQVAYAYAQTQKTIDIAGRSGSYTVKKWPIYSGRVRTEVDIPLKRAADGGYRGSSGGLRLELRPDRAGKGFGLTMLMGNEAVTSRVTWSAAP